MNKVQYLIESCNHYAWARLTWRLSIFNMSKFPENVKPEKYDLTYNDGYAHYWDGEWIKIEDAPQNAGLFTTSEVFSFKKEDYPGALKDETTTAGRWVYAWVVFWFSFQEKLGYPDPKMKVGDWEKLLYKMCTDFDDTEVEDESKVVRPWQVGRFFQGHSELGPMCSYIAPTGTLRTLTTHPDWYKVRDALLVKHKDELDDINVVLKIQAVGDQMDDEWLKQDQSIKFFNSKKARMRRRKLLVMHGIETAFQDPGSFTLVPKSLAEDLDVETLVAQFNATRMGSYGRGADTAKGGDAVRVVQMIYQNHTVSPGDCGTKATHDLVLTEEHKFYIGLNIMENGKVTELTSELFKQKLGKIVKLRRPIICANGYIDCCSVCGTANKALEPRAIAADIAEGQSGIMLDSMAAMHGKDVEVAEYNPLIHIS